MAKLGWFGISRKMPKLHHSYLQYAFYVLHNVDIYHIDVINRHNIHRYNLFRGRAWSCVVVRGRAPSSHTGL